jgi:nucleoside-diphosphate-sugar epimerase
MILVTGATGHVGGEVVAQLAASPHIAGPIRAMTRRPQATRDYVIGVWHREAQTAVTGGGFEWTLLRPGRFPPTRCSGR